MNVTSLVWYKVLPAKFGGQKAIVQLSEAIARRLPFEMICSSNNERSSFFPAKRILPLGKGQVFNPIVWRKIEKELKSEVTTHLLIEHCYYGLFGWYMKKKHGMKIILRHHNIEAARFREINKTGWQLLRWYEMKVSRMADLNLYLTEEDRSYAKSHYGIIDEHSMVIPYTVSAGSAVYDKEKAQARIRDQYKLAQGTKILLFNGTLDYQPNAEAVELIYKKIVPALVDMNLDFHFFINGRNVFAEFRYLQELSSPFVTQTGNVEDPSIFMQAADAYINPVRTGGGIQTKTLEALAANVNVVCFDKMMQGIDTDHCNGKLFSAGLDDWEGFIQKIRLAITADTVTPKAFYDAYDILLYAEKLAERLNSL